MLQWKWGHRLMCSPEKNRQQECENNPQRVASNQAKGKCSQPTWWHQGFDFAAGCVCAYACVDCKGPLDRALFTHPDRQRAVKNCTIFPLKSLLILRSNVFTAASHSLFSCFPLCVCTYVCECLCVCVCVCAFACYLPPFFTQCEQKWKTKKVGANCLRRAERQRGEGPSSQTPRNHLFMQNPQYDSQSNQLATFPRNVISGIFWGLI